jgi:hypothetical protein
MRGEHGDAMGVIPRAVQLIFELKNELTNDGWTVCNYCDMYCYIDTIAV